MVINVMTTVYLIRHSEKNRNVININNNDSFQLTNEKITLSVNGEKKANLLSYSSEMQDIDSVFSSNYVRAVETAKYIAEKNNTNINRVLDFLCSKSDQMELYTNNPDVSVQKRFEMKKGSGWFNWCTIL